MTGSIDEEKLIKLVESHRILYDRRLGRSPQNVSQKQRVWQEVSAQLNTTEHACITRWRNLRDRFGREYRRLLENPGLVASWYLFPNLLFLKDHYKAGNISTSDVVLQFKYEPKPKKRKLSDANDTSNDDLDTDKLLFNQQLIGLVKEHPVLYHRKAIRNFKNLTLKNEAWQQISENMGATEAACYERWKLLRDKFARMYRQQQLQPRKPILWAHYRDLLFLKEHYRKGIPLDGSLRKDETSPSTDLCFDHSMEYDNNAENELHVLIEALQSDDETADEEFQVYASENEAEVNEHTETLPASEINIEALNPDDDSRTVPETLAADDVYVEVDIDAKREHQAIVGDSDNIEISNASTTHNETLEETVSNEDIATCASLEVELLSEGTPGNLMDSHSLVDPATKLAQLISSMQTALEQSQNCLSALQQQPEVTAVSRRITASCTDRTMLHKILVLLEGLTPANRIKAEKEILKFLRESQLRQEANLEIDDLCEYDVM